MGSWYGPASALGPHAARAVTTCTAPANRFFNSMNCGARRRGLPSGDRSEIAESFCTAAVESK